MNRLAVFSVAFGALILLLTACGGGQEEEGVLAVAFRLDEGSPVLSAYIGDPREHPLELPPGSYYVEALDHDGLVMSFDEVVITDEAAIDLPTSFEASGGVDDAARAEALKTIVSFLVDAEYTKLSALELCSGGFETELFSPESDTSLDDLDRLYELYDGIVVQEEDVLAAVDYIETQAAVSISVPYVRATSRPPAAGVFDKIKDTLFDFFGYAGGAGKRAREQIVQVADSMSPGDKQGAFHYVTPAWRGDAKNFDQFLERLKTGELDIDAAHIRKTLLASSPECHVAAQTVTKSDRVGLSIAHKEGGQLVTKGFNLNVKVWKTVLGAQFGDIEKGFDLADKVNEWAEYAKKVYTDPLGTAEGEARGKVKDKIKARIKKDAAKWLPEDLAEKLAEKLSGEIIAKIPKVARAPTVAPAAKSTATPVPPSPTTRPEPTATGQPGATATSVGATSTPGPEPTPDTSWIEPFVQSIANRLLDEGHSGVDVAVAIDELRACLYDFAREGWSKEDAMSLCADVVPIMPTPVATETPSPAATGTPGPTATSAPQGRQVTVVGEYVENYPFYGVTDPDPVLLRNTMTLTFNTAGGPVTGEGHFEGQRPSVSEECKGQVNTKSFTAHYEGTYDPDLKQFGGTRETQYEGFSYYRVVDEAAGIWVCELFDDSSSWSTGWIAWWEDGVVRGWDEGGNTFELTVQD